MYFQQLYWRYVEWRLSRSLFGRWIHIRDQSINQDGSAYGSQTGAVGTIDLSSASDSVHVNLIRGVFPKDVLYYLLATRTTKVRTPDGEIRTLNKFAPMGSALCFPVQSILFTAITLLAYIYHFSDKDGCSPQNVLESHNSLTLWLKSHVKTSFGHYSPHDERLEHLSIFGDDIVCDSNVVDRVCLLLHELGFVVNSTKSFTDSDAFRESCGKYHWCGEDVTPIYFHIPHFRGNLDVETALSVVSSANQAGDLGYSNLRSFYINRLLRGEMKGVKRERNRSGLNPIIFTNDRSIDSQIFTTNVRNSHLETRWNCDYQRFEARTIFVKTKPRRGKSIYTHRYESGYYVRWWQAAFGRSHSPSIDDGLRSTDSQVTGLGWRWMPL
jgi:hypothetical protein